MPFRRAASVVVGLGALLVGSGARAEGDVEPIAVSYDAPAECPAEDAFVGEIAVRTPRFRRVARPGASRELAVRVTRTGAFTGELTLREGDATSVRVVHDDVCSVVVSGLALIAALAIDPAAALTPMPEPGPAAIAAPEKETSEQRRDDETTKERPRPPAPPIHVGVGVGVAARAGVVPFGAALTAAAIVALRPLGRIEPQARVELSVGAPQTEAAGGPTAELQWMGGHLEGCGLARLSALLGVGPCALVEAGAIRARGSQVEDPQSHTRLAGAAGVGVRGVVSTGRLYFDLGAFALVPFRRDRFYVDPAITLFTVSAVGMQVGTTMGVLF